VAGSWAIPIATVTTLITSVPGGVTLTVSNPTSGLPGALRRRHSPTGRKSFKRASRSARDAFDDQDAAPEGFRGATESDLVRSVSGLWEVICGGGDPYEVANAIFQGIGDINS